MLNLHSCTSSIYMDLLSKLIPSNQIYDCKRLMKVIKAKSKARQEKKDGFFVIFLPDYECIDLLFQAFGLTLNTKYIGCCLKGHIFNLKFIFHPKFHLSTLIRGFVKVCVCVCVCVYLRSYTYVIGQNFSHLKCHCAEQYNFLILIFLVGHPQWTHAQIGSQL